MYSILCDLNNKVESSQVLTSLIQIQAQMSYFNSSLL